MIKLNELFRHNWVSVHFVGPKNPKGYFGRKCTKCGLKTYAWGRLTRWRYADGRIADTQTIDEPSCDRQD